MHFIVTGGLGYIGAHTIIQLYKAGHTAIIIDNCINSEDKTIKILNNIVGTEIDFYKIDIMDKELLLSLLKEKTADCIIHFAALKNVGESIKQPLHYYQNNIIGLLNILELAKKINCYKFIFSSSATVYPVNISNPISEFVKAAASNQDYDTIITGMSPYGTSKLICEQILHEISKADSNWNIIILRYFNPVGNHQSQQIGDNFLKNDKSMNLFTAILNNVINKQSVKIFGNSYNTRDGTCIRDYIHVLDVADAHIIAAELFKNKYNNKLEVFNIGTGQGYSVLEIINKFNECGLKLDYEYVSPREGDLAEVWADCTKAKNILKWQPKYSLNDMVQSTILYFHNQLSNN